MNFPGAAISGGASGAAAGPQGYDPNDPNVKKLNALMESCFAKTAMAGVAGFGLGALFGMFMASMAYDTPYHTPMAAPAPTPTPGTATAAAAATAAKASASTTAPGATTSSGLGTGAAATTTKTIAAEGAAGTAGPRLSSLPRPTPLTAAAEAGASAAAAAAAAAQHHPATLPVASLPLRQQLAHGFRDMGARSYSTAKNFAAVGALFSGIECGIEGLRARNDMTNGVAAGCLTGAILARNGGPQAAAVGCAGFAAFSAAIDAWLRMPKDE